MGMFSLFITPDRVLYTRVVRCLYFMMYIRWPERVECFSFRYWLWSTSRYGVR